MGLGYLLVGSGIYRKYGAYFGYFAKKYRAVIFATTTPVRKENPYDKNVNIERFNSIIVPILKKRGIIINDLNALLKPDIYKYIREDNIHLSEEGIRLCASQVAQCVRETAKSLKNTQSERLECTEADEDGSGAPVLL